MIVTYCASRLPQTLLASTEVMIVTCESNPTELQALRACCARCADFDAAHWSVLGHLRVGQAIALPLTEETNGELRLFTIAPRLTPHVRHREKYVDVPVSAHRAFVMNENGQPEHRIRTLRQFVSALETRSARSLEGYIIRGDFSRWVGDVFGDQALAAEIRTLERRHRAASSVETLPKMANAVRGRYDLADDDAETGEPPSEPERRTKR